MTLNPDRARTLINQFASRRILVIGDLMLDRYIYGVVRRISPEAPVPVVSVTHETRMPGGASNVAWNVQTLGGQGDVAGIVGQDPDAEGLLDVLRSAGVGVEAIVSDPQLRTTVKTRVIADRQQVVRVDREAPVTLESEVLQELTNAIRERIAAVDGVVIEDYGKGVVTQDIVDATIHAARERGIPVGYDPKDDHPLQVQGVTVATPNRKEAFASVGRKDPMSDVDPLEDPDLLDVGADLLDRWGVKLLAITLGPQGVAIFEKGIEPVHIPTVAREVFDVSGAGDTVIATSTLALAAGASQREAIELANYAAGLVVGKLGTAPCHRDDLLECFA